MRLEHLLSGESGVFDAARPKLQRRSMVKKEHLLSGVAVDVLGLQTVTSRFANEILTFFFGPTLLWLYV